MAPGCPNFPAIFNDYVEMRYGVTPEYVNISYSGKNSEWPLSFCEEKGYVPVDKAWEEEPDLVIIGFGLNDGVGITPSVFIKNINEMVNKFLYGCPDAAVVVVGTMLPNDQIRWTPGGKPFLKYHNGYVTFLKSAEESWTNAAFADVTTFHKELLEIKCFQDTTGSNTNHPNDYMHRIYAQVIIQTVFGYE